MGNYNIGIGKKVNKKEKENKLWKNIRIYRMKNN